MFKGGIPEKAELLLEVTRMAMIKIKINPRGTAKFGRFCVKVREERLRWKHLKLVLWMELPGT